MCTDCSVKKNYVERPKYNDLLQHAFITRHDTAGAAAEMASYVKTNLVKFAAEFGFQDK